MIGKVCRVHQEYAPDGICRWCEPKRLPSLTNMEKDDPEFWATIREIEAANPSSESPIEKRLEAAHVAADRSVYAIWKSTPPLTGAACPTLQESMNALWVKLTRTNEP